MKIVFDKNDVYKTLGGLNDKTFMAASYVNSKEAWGLPTFRRLRFKKEAEGCIRTEEDKNRTEKGLENCYSYTV